MRPNESFFPAAFTSQYDRLSNKLINEAVVLYGLNNTKVKAQWDTGASGSSIASEVASKLGLIPTGKVNIQTPSGEKEANTYLVDIILPQGVKVANVTVCDSDIGRQGIGLLVGMDIINLGDFSVSNFDGKTVFSFRIPSVKTTDYVQQINGEKAIGQRHGKGTRRHRR